MNIFKNLKVAHKLALSIGICLVISIIAVSVAIVKMRDMYNSTTHLYRDSVLGVSALYQVNNDVKQYRLWQLRYGVERSDSAWQLCETGLSTFEASGQKSLEIYRATISTPAEINDFQVLSSSWSALVAATPDVRAACKNKNDAQIEKIEAGPAFTAYGSARDRLASLMKQSKAKGEILYANTSQQYDLAWKSMIFWMVIAVISGILTAKVLSSSMTKQLADLTFTVNHLANVGIKNINLSLEALAQGDLTVTVPAKVKNVEISSNDEIGALANSVNGMIESLRGMVQLIHKSQRSLGGLISNVRKGSDDIQSSSTQLAAGNHDLASRTTEQSSNLETTASSMEEITSLVRQSADRAKEANALAKKAKSVAEEGGDVVTKAVNSMQEISKSSKQISDIITVIDEIAFQTNLLALNAAVEAARVGEQGKGFAVVASEVRNLAGRSSTAAKEIKALVQDSMTKVGDGVSLVDRSGKYLEEIVLSVNKVAGIVSDITTAAEEQSTGIDQVNKAVIQMDEITQQNAALVEETAAASDSVSQLSGELHRLVKTFKIDFGVIEKATSEYAQAAASASVHRQVGGSPVSTTSFKSRKPLSSPPLRLSEFKREQGGSEEIEF